MTALPDAPVSVIAKAPFGEEPGETTDTWNDGPAVGAGVHWKAHPIFQSAAVVVNAGLDQFPLDWIGPSSTLAGVATADDAVVVVDELGTDVAVEVGLDPALLEEVVVAEEVVVVVLAPVEPEGGGRW